MEDKYNGAKGFKRVLLIFKSYLVNMFRDFFSSFKYNNMKLPGWLVALPGILIGFCLMYHAPVVKSLLYNYSVFDEDAGEIIEGTLLTATNGFDWSGISIFVLMLLGIFNIFTAASMMGKKNLGSVVLATVLTSFMVIFSVLYILAIFICKNGVDSGLVKLIDEAGNKLDYFPMNSNFYLSIGSIVLSDICAIAGVVLGFIFYDRTYEKATR